MAVNEIGSLDNMVYLLRYDTVHGRYERQVEAVDDKLVIDGKPLVYLSERDPEQLPWADLEVDLVLECTGLFTEREDAEKHVRAGASWWCCPGRPRARRADDRPRRQPPRRPDPDHLLRQLHHQQHHPAGGDPGPTLRRREGLLTTVHAYTATQALVDSPGGAKDPRRGRAAAQNFVPSSTGAATATAKALPAMQGRFDGVSSAARWPSGPSRRRLRGGADTTVDEVNDVLRQEASTDRYQGVLGVAEDPLVSADIVKDPRASIVQLDLTRVVGGNLVKVMSWYDNEGVHQPDIQVAVQQLGLDTSARV